MVGCEGHSHDHDHGDEVEEIDVNFRNLIDFPRVTCLNENTAGSAQKLLQYKTHEHRLEAVRPSHRHEGDNLRLLSSRDGDTDLLLYVPFTENVKLTSLSVMGPNPSHPNYDISETSSPTKVKIFVNRDDIGFDDAQDLVPEAEFDLVDTDHQFNFSGGEGSIDYPLRPAGRFQNVSSIVLYFPEPNYADDDEIMTEISYIGFKGKGTRVKRRAVKAKYETIGMVKDHEVADESMGRNLI